MKQDIDTLEISESPVTDKPYSAPAMVVAGSVGELTGGPITINAESYGFQAQ